MDGCTFSWGGTTRSRLVPHGRGGLKAQPSPSPIDASLGYLLLFKVHLSLIFLLRVFIRHLTLPKITSLTGPMNLHPHAVRSAYAIA